MLFLFICTGCGVSSGHIQTVASSPTYALTYVAIGASDAFGIGTDIPADQSWPTLLAHMLNSKTHLINLGIPQMTVAHAIGVEAPIAVDEHPDLITVWLGVNDYIDHVPLALFRQQLGTLLMTLHTQTHASIFVGNMPDMTQLPFFADYNQSQLASDTAAWNAAIQEICATTRASLVDIFSQFGTLAHQPYDLSSDGLHPSLAGAQSLADLFTTAIKANDKNVSTP
jgi:acyl-CoA thioesterase I